MKISGVPFASIAFAIATAACSAPVGAQTSLAPLEAATVVADDQAKFVATLDYDADGSLDALSVWFPSTVAVTIRGYRNDRAGRLTHDWGTTFVGIQNPGLAAPTSAAAAGDIDGDGRGDFVLAINDTIGWWISNGAGAMPTLTWIQQTGVNVDEILVADFDGNGRDDVATRQGDTLKVWLTPLSGAPQIQSTTSIGTAATHMLFRADGDGDANPDVGTLSTGGALGTSAFVQIFPAATGGALTSATGFVLQNVAMPMPACGDIDGDGDEDIVVFSMPQTGAAYYHVARRAAAAAFVQETATVGGPATHLIDVDLDGDLDGACCSGGGGTGPATNVGPSKFEIAMNDGSGQFAPSFVIAGLGSARLSGASDLDHDGDIDLVAGRCVYYGKGASGLPPFPSAFGVDGPRDLADVDGDGDPDFRALVPGSQRNAGDGTFFGSVAAPAAPPGRTWATNGFAGDFDSDGDVDWLLDALPGIPNTYDETHLLENLGCGVFVDAGIVSPPGVSMAALPYYFGVAYFNPKPDLGVVADLDLDGDLDIVVTSPSVATSSSTTGYSRVWWNQGGGTSFTPSPGIDGFVALAAADADQDGIVDLVGHQHVIANFSNLVVRRGTGTTFVAPGQPGGLPILDNDTRLVNKAAIADFDGDGDVDVVSFGNTTGRRYLNSGNGTFVATQFSFALALPVSTSYATVPPAIALQVDLDADGLLDVVLTPLRDNPEGCGILFNADVIASAPPASALIRQVFQPQAFADLDGDGDQDAVGFTLAARNNRFGPGGAGRRVQYGQGIAGAGGIVPILGETGPLRVGNQVELRVRGGVGGASGYLVLGNAPAADPVAGGTLLATPDLLVPIQLGGAAGVPGAGALTIPWVIPPSLAWASFFKQAGFLDAAAPFGISATNGLSIEIRP